MSESSYQDWKGAREHFAHGKAPPTTPKFQHSRHFIIIAVIVVVVVIVVVIIIIITFLFCETLNYATIKSRIH